MRSVLKAVVLGVVALAPQLSSAEDAALIVVETDYRRLPDLPGAAQAAQLARMLEDAGFRVVSSLDQDAPGTWSAVEEFRVVAEDADRVFVLLSGHMVSSARDTHLLTRFSVSPSDVSVGGESLALGPILDTVAAHPGQAVVMLAPSNSAPDGAGLEPNVNAAAPQGVTLVTGPLVGLMEVAEDVFLVPGESPATALGDLPRGVTLSGFVSDAVPFLPGRRGWPRRTTPAAPTWKRRSGGWSGRWGRSPATGPISTPTRWGAS